ncbi:uncharacterized protein LOC107043043 [Diachasma alloeum]|uniref:uncharacterized protein LOC107043043 n=1 Tax=Diachasma alloeum TaxID=454923 RepID=UPI0007382967|nr:uncharacterized protein LOC107043043 [Diachasma alloeum]
MENGGFFDALSSSEDIITLLQTSQSLSSSSTSTDQSKSIESPSGSLRSPSRNLNEEIEEISRGKWRRKLRGIGWNKYIRWDLLFTFGFILWVALCIADSICPRTIYIMREKKLRVEGTRDFEVTWTLKSFSYISHYVIPNLMETFVFLVVFGVFAVTENCMKKKWFNNSRNIRQNDAPLLSIYHERDFLFDGLDESEDTCNDSEYPEEINYIKIEEGRKLRIHPELYWHWRLFRGIAEITTRVKRKSKRLNKLGLHTSTSGAKGLLEYDPEDKCSVQPYETYDQEIYRFIKAEKNSSTTAFNEIIAGLQNTRRKYPTWTSSSQKINSRIISSSPAFKDFLSKLKKNPSPCNRLTF